MKTNCHCYICCGQNLSDLIRIRHLELAIHYFHDKLSELSQIQKFIFKIKVEITVPLSVSCKKPLFGCIPINHD